MNPEVAARSQQNPALTRGQALPIYTVNPKDFAATGAELVDLGEEAEHPTP